MPTMRQDFSPLIVSFFREICGESPSQIAELSCGLKGAALTKPDLARFLSAIVALLLGGTASRSGDPDSLGLVGKSVALALGRSRSASGLCHR